MTENIISYIFLTIEVTPCIPDPCQNGECELTLSGYRCHCDEGYFGRTCNSEYMTK